MKQDDIIRKAREAGAWPELSATPEKDAEFLQRFAALVAAAEREACAKVCDGWAKYGSPPASACADAIRARGQALKPKQTNL